MSGYVKLVTLYCHAIFWDTEGFGEGCVKIMQIVACLELMTNLFILIHNGGNEKLLYGPTEKWCSFFWYESFSKGYNVLNEFRFQSHMRFCLTQLSATRFYGSLSVYSHPLPSEKIAPWQPGRFLLNNKPIWLHNYWWLKKLEFSGRLVFSESSKNCIFAWN